MPTLDATQLSATAVSQITLDFANTQTHVPTETPTATETTTPIPTLERTRPSMDTPTSEVACNIAAAGQPFDVTIPDDTRIETGRPFSKTWRLENAGSCIWTRQYAVTFFSGNSLGANFTHYLQEPVTPGGVVDITIDMVAPDTIGIYQGNWMLSDPESVLFGIGPHGDAPFWVRIEAIQIITDTPTSTPIPTSTLTPTPIVSITGEAALEDGDQLDLDSGTLNPDGEDAVDLVYAFEDTPLHLLTPLNDTTWAVFGDTEPRLAACSNVDLSDNAISFNEVPDGTFICYRTSQARWGWLMIEGFEAGILSVSFLIWSVP
jgi:hypothetical protein